MSLRIIGGEFRRRVLKTPDGKTTRPYTDRVRQIVFDRLGEIVENARVADVFSGVGTMGIESLSRGADSCVFFEFDGSVHESLKRNVSTIVPNKPTVCWKTSVHRTSFCPKGADVCLPYTLIFFDPPYDQSPLLHPKEALGKSLNRLAKPRASTSDAIVVLRTPQRVDFSETPVWKIDDHWPISSMNVWILGKANRDQSDEKDSDSATTLSV